MSKPLVYGPGFSTYVRTVRLALEEKGVEYDLVEINFLSGPMPAEQIARQPFGKVPAFEHDGLELYETVAINQYVDEVFEGPPLQPADARGRARMNQIISILNSYTYPCTITQLFIQRVVMPMLGNQSDEAAIEAALPEVSKCMKVLSGLRASNTFLVGDQLTLADLYLIPIYDYFQSTPESGPILDENPALRTWWDAVKDRESVKKTQPSLG